MLVSFIKKSIEAVDRPITSILNSISGKVDIYKNKILIYTIPKAGSMVLHQNTYYLSNALGINYYSINDNKYYDLIKSRSWKALIEDKTRYGCFGPIRGGEALPNIPDFVELYPKILNVRDPRDVLTSLYYSFVYSHPKIPVPGGFNPDDDLRSQWEKEGIDAFVIRNVEEYKRRYDILCNQVVGKKNLLLLKYEDMVLNYGVWLEKYISMFMEIRPVRYRTYNMFGRALNLKRIYNKLYKLYINEFKVSSEDPKQHKRQMLPGDYKRKLKTETIEILNREFSSIIKIFGYE